MPAIFARSGDRAAPAAVEYVLIDDHSDAELGIVQMLQEFRGSVTQRNDPTLPAVPEVRIVRFHAHRHYAFGLAAGLSLARGDAVLFVSPDMIIAPACLRTLLEAAATHEQLGVIRPRSAQMEVADPYSLKPPLPLRNMGDVNAFSQYARQFFAMTLAQLPVLIGDAMLIKRSVIDRIGVFDPRFYRFMADVDYGLRAERAGFQVALAMGAWLHSEGSGVTKSAVADNSEAAQAETRQDEVAAYHALRDKWDKTLPPNQYSLELLARLRTLPSINFELHQPLVKLSAEDCDVLE